MKSKSVLFDAISIVNNIEILATCVASRDIILMTTNTHACIHTRIHNQIISLKKSILGSVVTLFQKNAYSFSLDITK